MIGPFIGLAAVAVGGWFMIRFILLLLRTSAMCQFCGNPECMTWRQLSENRQRKIMAYFLSHEGREPDKRGIFVCDQCKTVFDDFSGMRQDPEIDTEGGGRAVVTMRAWCKVCNNLMQACDPDNDNIHCRTCETRYSWKKHKKSGYRFLMPPKNAKVRKRCRDLSGVG